MKNLLLIFCSLAMVNALAQDSKETKMEARARELHRVMGLSDKEQWKKFMKENYTKSLLERPVKSAVETTDKESSSSTKTSTADNLEEKLKVFERLHNNFKNSKILSLKPVNGRIEMIIENPSHVKANFSITFENKQPYLIDGIRAEVDQQIK